MYIGIHSEQSCTTSNRIHHNLTEASNYMYVSATLYERYVYSYLSKLKVEYNKAQWSMFTIK